MTRLVGQLAWAYRGERPQCVGLPAKRDAAKQAGIKYEAALAAAIPVAHHGIWWQFCETGKARGGWCQTDLLLQGTLANLVLEAKYSYTEDAWDQLEGLYIPVVTRALGARCLGIQVCKRFLAEVNPDVAIANDLAAAIQYAQEGRRTVLHWLGAGKSPPLWPLRGHLAQAA